MKKIIICFSLLFVTMCFSQVQMATIMQKQDSVKLESFLKIGTSLFDLYAGTELAIAKDFTINIETGFSAIGFRVFKKQDRYEENRNYYRMYLDEDLRFYFAKSEFRWNYNFQKRHKEWKETSGNSSDYIAIQTKYTQGNGSKSLFFGTPNNGSHDIIFTSFQWGMQRQMGYNFVFNLFFGYGWFYDFQIRSSALAPSFGLKLNYHLIKL